jgi:uncharacterized protein
MELLIKDPIHGFIRLDSQKDQLALDLMNTAEMQRLRRIRQLSTSSMVFPTADHSRFSHSLGTFALTQRIMNHLLNAKSMDPIEYEELYPLITVAGLLHDIGHGPFSHVFETLTQIHHEALTIQIINEKTTVNKILRNYDPRFPHLVIQIITNQFNRSYCNNIISGMLDADRMDFISRDSYMSGIHYGSIDVERIISVLRIQDDRLVILEKGIGVIEEFLLARYYMYSEIYYHKVGRGASILLQKCLQRSAELIQKGDQALLQFPLLRFLYTIPGTIDLQVFLELDDTDIYVCLKGLMRHNDAILRDLAQRFINRGFLKTLFNVTMEQKEWIQHTMTDKGYDPHYYYVVDAGENSVYHEGEATKKDEQQQIQILMRNGSIVPLNQVSKLVNVLQTQRVDEVVYLPEEIRAAYRSEFHTL